MRVQEEILREAHRLIVKHENVGRLIADEGARRARRSFTPKLPGSLRRPPWWDADAGFDPYLTRSRSARISHSVRNALIDRRYEPRRPYLITVPKSDGSRRPISIYQVADSAISKMLFESVLRKNLSAMSARSYAYRKDLGVQDAIRYIKSELTGRDRLFIAEYDFSKYFDHIDHEYIERILSDHFLVTKVERAAIRGFLRVLPSEASTYQSRGGPVRTKGIPQGTSVSLMLANIAAWELDRELERQGVGFVRYADDTLLWSTDYSRICTAVDALHSYATAMGVSVNAVKSPGISLLTPQGVTGELRTIDHVDYLGYRIRHTGVFLKPEAEAKIKRRVEQLIFNTLLREPLAGTQRPSRLASNVDRDYVVVIARLRRYMYGDLSEKSLRHYQSRGAPLRRFKGVMSAYQLVDDTPALLELDKWILTRLWLALRKRGDILLAQGHRSLPSPHGLPLQALRKHSVVSQSTGLKIDLSVPSVRRIARGW